MELRDIAPERLSGMNYPKPATVERIAASMRAKGWEGRPLLVEEGQDGRWYAWTGSHRIEAAKAVGLAAIPCRVITRGEGGHALARLPDTVGFQALRKALKKRRNGGGPSDPERLAGLRQLGLDEAAAVLEEEIGADEW
jgi:hypothetical protein